MTYGGIGGGSLASVTRGKYGSRARFHASPVEHRALVTAGGARHWQGRVATVWLCLVSADGTTLSDPSLIYMGSVGAGIQLTGNLMKWSVPLDHVTESMGRKLSLPSVNLYGWAHFARPNAQHPLAINDNGLESSLTNESDDINNEGWHPDLASFVRDADRRTVAVHSGVVQVATGDDGRIRVTVQASAGTPHHTYVSASWDDARWDNVLSEEFAFWHSTNPAPTDCFNLDGWVKIPTSLDFSKIPTTFSWPTTPTAGVGSASLALTGDTKNTKGVVATIVERDATRQSVRVEAALPTRATMNPVEINRATLCTERTDVQLGVVARGDSPIAALKAAALAIDAIGGQDLYSDALDWVGLERAFSAAPSRIPPAREYRFGGGDDTFLSVLTDEARLHGLCLATANGLVTAVQLATFADTEDTVASITEDDLLTEGGQEIPAEVIDSTEPLATSMQFLLPTADRANPRTATVTDTTYQGEFGDGELVKCGALLSLPRGVDLSGVQSSLLDVAQQVLGALAEPSRSIRLPVSGTLLGLQPGQLVLFTHSRIPTWTGVRGFIDAVCQVVEVRRVLFGGKMRGTVVLRLQSGTRSGYAPEALVASGGLSSISPVVTLDVASGWGAAGFALPYDAEGVATTDPAYGFEIGQVVRLTEFARAPVANEQFTIVDIDRTAHTVTLDAPPTATMASAAVAYGVSLRFASYGAAAASQQSRWAWVADPTTQLLDSTDAPKRWA